MRKDEIFQHNILAKILKVLWYEFSILSTKENSEDNENHTADNRDSCLKIIGYTLYNLIDYITVTVVIIMAK